MGILDNNFEAFLVGITFGAIVGIVIGTLFYDFFFSQEQQHD